MEDKVKFIKKLRALPNDLQHEIVKYLKNDMQLKRMWERHEEIVTENMNLEDQIENLNSYIDHIELEHQQHIERLREAEGLIMDLLLENRTLRNQLNTERDVRRRLNFDGINLTSDNEN